MGVNWEGLGEGVIAFLKKELDCKSECSKWGTFLTPNKKKSYSKHNVNDVDINCF